jgi:hypothetical protein
MKLGVVVVVLAASREADACVEPPMMRAVEMLLEHEQYWIANFIVPVSVDNSIKPGTCEQPLVEAQHLISIRWHPDPHYVEQALAWFMRRHDADPSPRVAARLAEAQVAANADQAVGLRLLRELRELPDARAYATFAKLTTGAERARAKAECVKRATVKSICD